jgi:hypothetical protein
MNRRLIGLIAVMGSALGAWWWTSAQRRARMPQASVGERGTVIFHNAPLASDVDAIV